MNKLNRIFVLGVALFGIGLVSVGSAESYPFSLHNATLLYTFKASAAGSELATVSPGNTKSFNTTLVSDIVTIKTADGASCSLGGESNDGASYNYLLSLINKSSGSTISVGSTIRVSCDIDDLKCICGVS